MYKAQENRYDNMTYRRCGLSGLHLPIVSLGLWHNFGDDRAYETSRALLRKAFDLGITHFDLANNYGPPPGSAEKTLGRAMRDDFIPHRDELIISTKAGYRMTPGPYGEWGSRKAMLSSLDRSLQRMGLEYVDIFYSHRPDPDTPLEETMGALDSAVRQGKALYAGISSYSPERTRQAADILRSMGTPCLIHQPSYNMLNRNIEDGVLDAVEEKGMGLIAYCPLAQGMLTSRYLTQMPRDSRAVRDPRFLKAERITETLRRRLQALSLIATERGQSIAQMALSWVLRDPRVTSALIGASKIEQIEENAAVVDSPPLTDDQLARIDAAVALE